MLICGPGRGDYFLVFPAVATVGFRRSGMLDPGHFQGESTETVIAPAPLGRMGTRIAEVAALASEHRPLDLYPALAEAAR